jgi:hypothetical protein
MNFSRIKSRNDLDQSWQKNILLDAFTTQIASAALTSLAWMGWCDTVRGRGK